MDKQTLNSYGWVVVAVIIICILISLATPFASVIRANIENVVGGMQDIGENAWENDAPTDFGDLSYIKDTRTGPVLAEKQTWYKGSTAKANIKQIDILTSYTPESTPDEQWIADADGAGTIMCYVEGDKLTIAGDGSECIKLNVNSTQAFSEFTNVTTITNCDLLNTSQVDKMGGMFYNCKSLTTVDVSRWDTSKATNMKGLFENCLSLTSLKIANWDVSGVADMTNLFKNCSSLTKLDISKWNVSNVQDMNNMFRCCFALTELDVSNWNVGNVQDMQNMFGGDNYGETTWALKTLDVSKWNTSNVIDMSFMFYGFNGDVTLDVSNWNVSKVKNFDHMFAHSYITLAGDNVANWNTDSALNMYAMLYSLKNTVLDVSNFKTGNVTAFGQMFEACYNLQEIIGLENFNTAKGVDFTEMFNGCTKLQTLNLSSFDTRNAKDDIVISANGSKSKTLYRMFNNCNQLKQITVGPNFSFNGDGTTTDATHVGMLPDTASGYWYTADGTAYTPEAIATTLNKTENTYSRENDDSGTTPPMILEGMSGHHHIASGTPIVYIDDVDVPLYRVALLADITTDAILSNGGVNKSKYGFEITVEGSETQTIYGVIGEYAVMDGVRYDPAEGYYANFGTFVAFSAEDVIAGKSVIYKPFVETKETGVRAYGETCEFSFSDITVNSFTETIMTYNKDGAPICSGSTAGLAGEYRLYTGTSISIFDSGINSQRVALLSSVSQELLLEYGGVKKLRYGFIVTIEGEESKTVYGPLGTSAVVSGTAVLPAEGYYAIYGSFVTFDVDDIAKKKAVTFQPFVEKIADGTCVFGEAIAFTLGDSN